MGKATQITEEEKREKVKVVRKLLRLANSLILVLPETYIESLGLKPGDEVELYFNKYLYIKPKK